MDHCESLRVKKRTEGAAMTILNIHFDQLLSLPSKILGKFLAKFRKQTKSSGNLHTLAR